MKCLLFLFSGLLIACSNCFALAQINCNQNGNGAGTGQISAMTNTLANAVSSLPSNITALFSSLSSPLNMLMSPLQSVFGELFPMMSNELNSVQSSIPISLTNTLLSGEQLLSVIQPLMNIMESTTSAVTSTIPFFGLITPIETMAFNAIMNVEAALAVSVNGFAFTLLEAATGMETDMTSSLTNIIGLVGSMVPQSIQMVTQSLSSLLNTASGISNTTITPVIATVSSLGAVLSGGVPNLMCASGSTLPGVSGIAQEALQSIETPLQGLTNTLSGAVSILGPTVLAPLQSLEQLLSQMTNMSQMGK